MTLKDHFHDPLATTHPWDGFHSMWASSIAMELNRVLPSGFYAISQTHRGSPVEVDLAAFQTGKGKLTWPNDWRPEQPSWSAQVEWPERDYFEVRVVKGKEYPKLIAAIELVSPSNKDRPLSRAMFAGKCAGYLRVGIGLIVVDIVTDRQQNLHELILELLELEPSATLPPDIPEKSLYAVAYRTAWNDDVPRLDRSRLEEWPRVLRIGEELPTLPLWLASEFPVPVDLAKSYAAVCESLRIE
jgi:hypothetical protein